MAQIAGMHFFISIDVLLTFDKVGSQSSFKGGHPGKPQQKVLRSEDGALTEATSYPCVTLLLSTLKATGNRVHVLAPWRRSRINDVIALFGWGDFVTDTRSLRSFPGSRLLSLASLGCDAPLYASSVVLVPDLAVWEPMMAAQLICVDHGRTAALVRAAGGGGGTSSAASSASANVTQSMELLSALCRCVTLAEWRIRTPGTPIAASAALSAANVFGCCRFFIPSHLETARLASLLNSHGALMVNSAESATHVLYAGPSDGGNEDGSSHSDQSSSPDTSDSDSEGSSNSSSSSSGSGDEEAHGDALKEAARLASATEPSRTGGSAASNAAQLAAPAITAAPAASTAPLNGNAQYVTAEWIQGCCRALRLLPAPLPSAMLTPVASHEVLEFLRTSAMLLVALLPPVDARPLPFSQFLQICTTYNFPTGPVAGATVPATYGNLLELFRGVALARQIAVPRPEQAAGALERGVPETTIVLFRHERKREREAVADHQRLLAAQFAYSFEAVLRERRVAKMRDGGTQTSGPRFAHARVGTEDAATAVAPGVSAPVVVVDVGVPLPAVEPPAPSAVSPTLASRQAEGNDEEEWKAHLKNAEGKVLKSTPQESQEAEPAVTTDTVPAEAESVLGAPAPPQSIFAGPPVLGQRPQLNPHFLQQANGFMAHPSAPPVSILSAPPPPPPRPPYPSAGGGDSIFPMPEAQPMYPHHPSSAPAASSPPPPPPPPAGSNPAADVTRCSIDVSGLSLPHQRDLFQYVQLMPVFSSFASTARAEQDPGTHTIACRFATAHEAAGFAKHRFIDFGGRQHVVTPCTGDGRSSPTDQPLVTRAPPGAGTSLSSMRSFQVEDLALSSAFYSAIASAAASDAPSEPKQTGEAQQTTAEAPMPQQTKAAAGESLGRKRSRSPVPPTEQGTRDRWRARTSSRAAPHPPKGKAAGPTGGPPGPPPFGQPSRR